MDPSLSTTSRRTQDDEIDWASKLKALDQGDNDDAAEQKRLQEEIAAARQARQRRSRGLSAGRTDSLESGLKDMGLDDPTRNTADRDVVDKKDAQDTALRKLMGTNNVYNPDRMGTTISKEEPPSLAAFIGGRASGPRLNKHAPQADAQDPTQFIQPNLSAPHPVFGRGGVAMPGMITARKSPGPHDSSIGSGDYEQHRPSSATRPLSVRKSMERIPRSDSTSPHSGSIPQVNPSKASYEPSKPFSVTTNTITPTTTPNAPRKAPSTSSIAKKYLEQIEQSNSKPTTPTPAAKPTDYSRPSFSSAAFSSPSFGSNSSPTPKSSKPEPAWSKPAPSVLSGTSNPNLDDPPPRSPVNIGSFASSKPAQPAPATPVTTTSPAENPRPAFTATKSTPAASTSSVPTPPWDRSNLKPIGTPLSKATSDSPSRAVPVKAVSTPPAFTSAQYTKPTGPSAESAQNTGLRKIMANNNVYNPDKLPRQHAQTPPSLAAFIGGHASGPRLNKHAPQPDAHDPTQFVQPDLSAPHPVFGKGGIAMPGMAGKKKDDDDLEDGGFEEHSKPAPLLQSNYARERTKSTPAVPSARIAPRQSFIRDDALQQRNSRPTSVGYYPQNTASNDSNRPRSFVTTPSLARPVQPEPKVSSFIPRVPATVTPSPAFQKPAAHKEPTPSLSRLKGRGFVQNMVKASFERETSVPRTPSPDKGFATSREPTSVRDRWQSSAPSTPKNTTPLRYHTPQEEYRPNRAVSASPTKLSFHVSDLDLDFNPRPGHQIPLDRPSSASPSKRQLKEIPDLDDLPPPSRRHSPAPVQARSTTAEPYRNDTNVPVEPILPKAGSSSTRIIIKPSKSSSDLGAEGGSPFGVRSRKTTDTDTSRKPLIHLTKGRARKPSKQHPKPDQTETSTTPGDSNGDAGHRELSSSPDTLTPAHIICDSDPPRDVSVGTTDVAHHSRGSSGISEPKENVQAQPQVHIPTSWEELFTPPPEETHHEPIPATAHRPSEPISPPAERTDYTRATRSPPPSPSRHKRIPSTGKRLTVMEVALTLQEQNNLEDAVESPVASSFSTPHADQPAVVEEPPPSPSVRTRRVPVQPEKRRSAYERYSMISLPPLKEELTPVPSPAGTLKGHTLEDNRLEVGPLRDLVNIDLDAKEDAVRAVKEVPSTIPGPDLEASPDTTHRPIPNISKLLAPWSPPVGDTDSILISVEVQSVVGKAATVLNKDSDIFYDSEILLVVGRSKSKSTGLASTTVWCWLGKGCSFGDKEQQKVNEVAKRYGTSPILVHQWAEPHALLKTLEMRLTTRQGTRTRWSPENTTMHVVRSYRSALLIDECEFNVSNLCSGFSYCMTILDSVYVWHGRGSTPDERQAALDYVKRLGNNLPTTEITEGVDDDDEMFWMMLGSDEYAKADYWKWRNTTSAMDPSVWRVTLPPSGEPQLERVDFISMEPDLHKSIYVIDCVWEIFVLVSKDARGDRPTIRLALDAASYLSQQIASKRPYDPTIHTLILPSRIPLDLLMNMRDLDEAWLNQGEIPDHMNLLPFFVAVHQVNRLSWDKDLLKDENMLPLGVIRAV